MIVERITVRGLSSAYRTTTATVELEALAPGVYAWCGPCGAGKTTMMECVPAALYRWMPSYGYAPIAHVAPGVRDAVVELRFRIGGARWRIRLQMDPMFNGGRGKTEHFLDMQGIDGSWIGITGPNVRETSEKLEEEVPSRELFLAGPYAAQRGAGSFFQASKAEKKRLFVELLGHGQLQVLSGRAAERAKSVAVDLERLRREETELRALEARRLELGEQLVTLREAVEERSSAAGEITDTLAELRRTAEDARAAVARIEAEQRHSAARLAELAAERDRRRAAVVEVEHAYLQAQKAANLGEEVEAPPLALAEAAADETAALVADARKDAEEHQRALEHTRREIATATAAASLAGVDLSLEVCGRCPLTARAREAEQRLGALREAEAAILAHRDEISDALQRAEVLDVEAQAALALARAADQRARALEGLGAIRADLEAKRAEAQAATDRHVAALVEPAVGADVALVVQIEAGQALEQAERQGTMLRAALVEAERDAARTEGELRAVEAQIGSRALVDVQTALGTLTRCHRGYDLVAVGLGPNGAQALEIDAAGPGVSQLANDLLVETFGPRFQIRLETTRPLKSKDGQAEVFEVAVIDSESERVAHNGSGGEMVVIEEALRLALAIYTTRQSNKELLTLFRDEAAGALDQWPGRDSAGKYLAMLRAARAIGGFHHVHFIAHQPALYEAADGRFMFEGGGKVRFEEG